MKRAKTEQVERVERGRWREFVWISNICSGLSSLSYSVPFAVDHVGGPIMDRWASERSSNFFYQIAYHQGFATNRPPSIRQRVINLVLPGFECFLVVSFWDLPSCARIGLARRLKVWPSNQTPWILASGTGQFRSCGDRLPETGDKKRTTTLAAGA